uniref:EF-hand domain-containing protein n=1 Tax=Rhizochromulina marina TaxID=1034831 RepID=A0A7S2SHZ1_9STRA|mmetsp:Transcript_30537/g.88664  ORF Transcript_30537/g.88664 Transcript_30537/m.88664 type:complete len:193 (+) Transcript_30537:124-702(+)
MKGTSVFVVLVLVVAPNSPRTCLVTAAMASSRLPEEVRDARVRWPSLDDLLGLGEAWGLIPVTDRAAILYEDESLTELQREFDHRDADGDGELTKEEIVRVVDEFNSDEDLLEACFLACRAASEGLSATPRCTFLPYAVMRGGFDVHCTPTAADELAMRETVVLQDIDELLLSGDPDELGLSLNPDGTISDD